MPDDALQKMVGMPSVFSVSLMSGTDDYLLHVAACSPEALSDFVLDAVTSDPAVAGAQTSLVFRHVVTGGAWRDEGIPRAR